VNLLDLFLIIAIATAAFTGYRFGLAARALSWAGLAVGLVIGVEFVDDVARALQGSTPRTRLLASLAFLLLVAVIGQSLGIALGSLARRHLPATGGIRVADRVAGGITGVLGVLVVVWLLIPGLANAPGWTARAVRGSAIVRQIDRVAPKPPSSLSTLGRLVGDAPFPEVFRQLTSSDVGSPPSQGLPAAIATPVSAAVVKVEGQACDTIQQGSGFVASNGLVVTNAHVVAGERFTTVTVPSQGRLDALVVAFDPTRDLAVLRVRGLAVAPLPIVDAQIDETGGVFGYPGGGPESQAPARVAERIIAQGTDIYRSSPTQRDVLVLAAKLFPGNSGGPFVDTTGHVAGVAFAVDPGAASTAYALATDEVNAVLHPVEASGGGQLVDTGNCING
jgi:Trypsin-like peptidase domain/Colicin V production protein